MSTDVTAAHPYRPAVLAGGLAFVSGALSVDADYVPVAGRQEALDAAAERMAERLATVGGTLADIVKLTYYVTDLSLREEANRQLERLFAEARPARTFVEVSRLPYGATVEIDAIAQVRGDSTAPVA
ncbi:RidA family protein [Nocardia aurantia]|uniref:2-iminobutanoate/2-iminopropanoate deaminase n=1 Tax=Nocardia aurantia TaxID=2585199 RepID=A0A7K0DV45_9NOCA|nr:RidA family protein [Nocardia aurantia]MQY28694.1 2-iminobutanoate/2-iminopropanoate deaminase [Nocardia aurantia]